MSGIRCRVDYIINKYSLIFGSVQVILCVLVRILSRNPYEVLHQLNASDVFPPIWIFNLFSIIWSFVSGMALGIILYRSCMRRNSLSEVIAGYKGALFYIALVFLCLNWYSLFFCCRPAIALMISLLSVLCAIFCGIIWKSVDRYAALIILSYSVWLTYVFIINATVFLRN